MKTIAQLHKNILKITITIGNEFPELLPFLNEMPETIPTENSPKIDQKNLLEYYNSLLDILRNYAPNHPSFFSDF